MLVLTLQSNTFSGFFVGQNLVSLPSVDSTNNYLKYQLANSAPLPEGTVILAEEQFAGRGQIDHLWVSEPGKNLTFSILFIPSFLSPEKQFLLNKAVSIGINDVLYKIIGRDVKIKWPNDIYVRNKKLGGLLIENIIQGFAIKYSVVGVGLNVNQTIFPPFIKNVTSISKILQHDYDLKILLAEICRAIEVRYLQLKASEYDLINNEYISRLYRINIPALYKVNEAEEVGIIKGISETGQLQVQFGKELKSFGNNEIAFVI